MSSSENIENIEPVETLESLEAPKRRSRGRPKLTIDTTLPDENPVESPPKVKRQQSDKQKENFKKALEVRKQKIEERKLAKLVLNEQKEQEQLEKKVKLEKVIIKKAICLKKKEILSQAILDDVSDCDVPDEIVEKIIKRQRQKKVVPKPIAPVAPVESPKYKFV